MNIAATNTIARPATNAAVDDCIDLARWHVKRFLVSHPTCNRHREDLDSEAMLALVLARDRFDPTRGLAFPKWAGIIVRLQLKKWFARQILPHDVNTVSLGVEISGGKPTPHLSDSTGAVDAIDITDALLAELSPLERELVVGHYMAGNSRSDQQRISSVSRHRWRRIMARAFRKMRAAGRRNGVPQ